VISFFLSDSLRKCKGFDNKKLKKKKTQSKEIEYCYYGGKLRLRQSTTYQSNITTGRDVKRLINFVA
jgi:hypothetical protein